jgi:hypothetical protein
MADTRHARQPHDRRIATVARRRMPQNDEALNVLQENAHAGAKQ